MFSPKTPTPRGNIRKNSSARSRRSSTRKMEITHLPNSGLKIILTQQVIESNSSEQIRDQLIKYLKFEETYSKLRPVDVQIMNEYALTQVAFVKEFSEKTQLIINILLHIFFYRNVKYVKQVYAEKNLKDDLREFHNILEMHKAELNSLELRKLMKWEQDYIAHQELFYFKADVDDGLDIVYHVQIDVPTHVPPLNQSNFIPQNTKQQVEVDSEEEEFYARRSYTKDLQELKKSQELQQQLNNDEVVQDQQEETVEKPKGKTEFDDYIQEQVFGTSQQLFKRIESNNKQIIEQLETKGKKK